MKIAGKRGLAVLVAILALAGLAGPVAAQEDPGTPVYVPAERELFLRNTSGDCSGYALSEVDAADAGNGCSFVFGSLSILPGFENTFVETYPLDPDNVELPITLDASRPITGQIAISSVTPNAYIVDIVVTLGQVELPAFRIDGGVYTSSWFFEGGKAFPISIPIPAELDKTDINDASVKVIWRRYPINAVSTWTELDDPASKVKIPAFVVDQAP